MSSAARLVGNWDLGFGIWEFEVMASAGNQLRFGNWDLGFGNLK
jgi:hypothetical protein